MTAVFSAGTITHTQRVAARTAGYALLFMAVAAVFAFFIAIEGLVVPGDAAETVTNLRASEGLFRAGIAGFVVIAILDVVAAAAFFVLLEPVGRFVSLMAAAFRLVYAAILGAAVANLMNALRLVNGTSAPGEVGAALNIEVMRSIEAFSGAWELGLALFGVHLALVGYLFLRSGYLPRFVSVLVAIAGAGYLVDSFGAVLLSGYDLSIASVTFIGEILLIFWLLFGFRQADSNQGEPSTSDRELTAAR